MGPVREADWPSVIASAVTPCALAEPAKNAKAHNKTPGKVTYSARDGKRVG